MKKFAALMLAAAAISGCTGTMNNAQIGAERLQHHRYVLQSVNGSPLGELNQPARQPEISFGENLHVSGAMCNRFMGQGKLTGDILKVDGMASTRMMCAEPQLNALDKIIGTMLNNGARISLSDKQLTLKDADNTLVYTLADLVQ
ncbi:MULTISPECIES: heat shock protein HslJ [Tenebrionibacter/Tenebrionicola group]|jgi:heat shock protein HslJ|uniref:Heat shock protein HslJ n=2 Tax=Tenebrionibacter/Tenebrionicola group TaxID=2969848 RepID=A0A8K0V7E0_9ENTR|nr:MULTISPECIES: heat shock protein HslJ [Tenebrionibacter/Tenebrionicola group]MBK4715587.1 heat shock protein HslJ [Tenebrionibacter intestinalis]MBV5095830.1 heat shock protein HslJ [Tenebrionicola larvae]